MTSALRRGRIPPGVGIGAVLLCCLAVAALLPPAAAAPALLGVALIVAFRAPLASRRGLLVVLVVTVMWIPAGRYSIIGIPAALPWRLVVLGSLLVVFLSLALDSRVRWLRAPMIGLALAYPAAALLSVLANVHGLAEMGRVTDGAAAALQTFLILGGIFVAVRQFTVSSWDADRVCRLMVVAAGVVAFSAAYETVMHYNIFLNLQLFTPLQLLSGSDEFTRLGTARVIGSARHPIALSVALVMLLPLAVFLGRYSRWPASEGPRRWLFHSIAFGLVFGAFLSGSRTFIIMLGAVGILLFVVNWMLFTRLLLAAVPMLVIATILIPAAVIRIIRSLLDPDALIKSQTTSAGMRGSGRLADLGPSLEEAGKNLWFGTGMGSRIVIGPETNAQILDNQYLSTLLESGVVGVLGMAAFLIGPVVVMMRRVRDERLGTVQRDLALTLACVYLSYAVASFFFDAFAFQQTLMIYLIMLGVGSWLVATTDAAPPPAMPAPRMRPMPAPRRPSPQPARV